MKNWSLQAIATAMLFTTSALAQDSDTQAETEAIEAAAAALDEATEDLSEGQTKSDSRTETQLDAKIQDIFDRGCGDDRGQDRCDPEFQAKMRGYYGIESVEELAEAGSEVYRAMFVDGYGNDVVAVSFVREPGKSPYVDVRAPSLKPDNEQPLRTIISPERWSTVSDHSPSFDQKLAYEVARTGEPATMCLHGWVVVVESAEAISPHVSTRVDFDEEGKEVSEAQIVRTAPTIRRDTESACANGLAVPYAFDLAKEAKEALVECANLKIDNFRNATNFLAACHRLRGDRQTAARALSTIEKLQAFRSEEDIEDNSLLFVRFGDEAPKQYLADIEGGVPFFGQPKAISTTDVILEGMLYYLGADENELPTHQAKLTVNLYEYGSFFAVYSWNVAEKEPFVMPELP